MNKTFCIVLALIVCFTIHCIALADETAAASPTSSTVLVNGETVAFDAYNILGNNYFKLRDVAHALNGSEKQFDVAWDEAADAIMLTSGVAYTAVGNGVTERTPENKTAVPTKAKVCADGEEAALAAYGIDGFNYFKLRDIGKLFDFGVVWDEAADAIAIDTNAGYVEPDGTEAQPAVRGTLTDPYVAGDVVVITSAVGNQYEIAFEVRVAPEIALEMSDEANPKYNSHSFGANDTLYLAKLNIISFRSTNEDELFGIPDFKAFQPDGTPIQWNTLMYPIRPSFFSPEADYFWMQLIVPNDAKTLIGYQDRENGFIYFDLE